MKMPFVGLTDFKLRHISFVDKKKRLVLSWRSLKCIKCVGGFIECCYSEIATF